MIAVKIKKAATDSFGQADSLTERGKARRK
jgi:hypothetical protein